MKPRPFKYIAIHSLAELYGRLGEYGDEARILAGGQSLVPMMNLRVASPAVILDINACTEFRGILRQSGSLCLGALTRYCEMEQSEIVGELLPVIARALPHVAHLAIRNRGTLGGSLSLADPAAEMPACALLLDATMELGSSRGRREVAADAFFQGAYTTAMEPDEALLAVHYPERWSGEVYSFLELSRRHGDFAIAGIAARARRGTNGLKEIAAVGFGLSDRPVRLKFVEALLESGAVPLSLAAIKDSLARDVAPDPDNTYSPAAKIHLASELVRRVSLDLNRQADAPAGANHG